MNIYYIHVTGLHNYIYRHYRTCMRKTNLCYIKGWQKVHGNRKQVNNYLINIIRYYIYLQYLNLKTRIILAFQDGSRYLM